MDDLRICHIREPRHGAITAAFTLTPDGSLATGFSFCSAQDNFSRAIGRAVASGRAKKHPIEIKNIEKAANGKIDIVKTILKYLEACCATEELEGKLIIHKLVGVKDYYQKWGPFEHWLDVFVDNAMVSLRKRESARVQLAHSNS